MQDEDKVLFGVISEISAKAKMLRQQLHDRPDKSLEISNKTRKLEIEMSECWKELFPT